MKQAAVVAVVLAAVGVAVAAPMVAGGNSSDPAPARPAVEAVVAPAKGDTPMAERIATIGILNKRNGLSRDLRLKPGQAVRIGDAVVRVKACDSTADWEADQLTGAFVQLIVRNPSGDRWRKVFSGWIFKETPSLNVVEHPVYDVWAKDCTMRHAEVGPDTVTVSESAATPGAGGRRSRAAKSPAADAPSANSPADSAESSNAI